MKFLAFLGIAVVFAQVKPAMDAVNALSNIEYVYTRNEISTEEYNAMRTPVFAEIKESTMLALIGVLLFICAFI